MVELARVLYGSQNYGLDGPNSDRDYKVVLCPEFGELYEGRMCKHNEGVYRGVRPEFHRQAQKIRFDPPGRIGILNGIAEDVKRGFKDWNAELQNQADATCEGVDWKRAIAGMDEVTRVIVMKLAYGEIVRRCG